jgi:hypothetical protein
MRADPQLDTPDYSQGLAPEVHFTDRGRGHQVGQSSCVPLDCYTDVLVIDETSEGELGAQQYKYYAGGVRNIRLPCTCEVNLAQVVAEVRPILDRAGVNDRIRIVVYHQPRSPIPLGHQK